MNAGFAGRRGGEKRSTFKGGAGWRLTDNWSRLLLSKKTSHGKESSHSGSGVPPLVCVGCKINVDLPLHALKRRDAASTMALLN